MDESIEADPAMPPLSDCSKWWPVTLQKAWKTAGPIKHGETQTVLLLLALPATAVNQFGGMASIVLNVTLPGVTPSDGADAIEITLSWKEKTATRLAEASWLSFTPSVSSGCTLNFTRGNDYSQLNVSYGHMF